MNVTEVHPTTRNSQGVEANAFHLSATNSALFSINGGYYVFDVIATGSGSVTVQKMGPDGATLISTALTITATTGTIQGYLAPGQYQITIATFTAVYASLTSVPI